jgi:superfamily II DNA/RNA helicase
MEKAEDPKQATTAVAAEGEQIVEKTEEQKEEDKAQEDKENAEYLKPNWDESVDKFDDMGLKEEILRGIYGYGFNKPS